ncbi:hypothetical protein GLOIN_2v1777589 [Rhizophagus clarus]|uniref:Uncharacterized protein n=1 Tax=Rhizophagus clarus TaxID=94130 RepID=A0A8H3QFD4_9GLOM|nr:hypothetical protein GLOIN_2v1777589 [Rhizophagus clarus]
MFRQENLIAILKEFKEITRILGGSKYIILSLIYLSILKLKDSDEILEEFEEIPNSEIADTIEINKRESKKKLNILRPVKIKGLALLFLEVLEGTLKKYWSVFFDIDLLISILDPKSKKLVRFSVIEKQEAIILFIRKYKTYNIFGENESCKEENKVDEYLKLKPIRNIDLLS